MTTTAGATSNGITFTVIPPPTLSTLTPTSGHIGDPVTIAGNNFLATQGTSTVTFNGTSAAPTSWSNTSITAPVPSGATSGNVVVTVSSQTSNTSPFTVIVPGSIGGTVTRATGGAPLSGATVQAFLAGVLKGSATTAADGTYTIASVDPATYDVRVSASGYSTEVRSGIAVSSSTTATVNVAMLQPGSVGGVVTQSDGVTPIVGAAMSLYSGPVLIASAGTTSGGNYSISNVRPGAYTIRASYAGYRSKEQGVTVSENTNATANISLDAAAVGSVNYVYDELGRLVQVTDQSGDTAIYRYDLVGNIVAIERSGTTSVSISEFTPNSGPVGTTVTIYGSGFSSTPASNGVTFGGVAATVLTATTTQLTVTAPAGGQVAVSSPNGSANSGSNVFAITTAMGAPTITGFTPGTVAAGTALTVNGTNFDSVAGNNNLLINASAATVTSATATALKTSVPLAATTGRITVATVNGTAVTSNYLWMAPPPYGTGDLDTTGTLPFATATQVSVAANKVALRVFDGVAGHRASIAVSNPSTSTNVSLYDAFGNVIGSVSNVIGSAFIDSTTLRSTATYSVVMNSASADTATLELYDVPPDVTGTIAAGGSAVTISITTPGQNGSLTFAGTAGHKMSLLGTNGTITGQILGCDVNVSIFNPDKTPLVSNTCMEGNGFVDATTLPATGTYTIVVDPVSYAVGNLTLTLYDVTDVTGSITADGTPVSVSITTPGQNGRFTFSGTAGQRVSLEGSNGTISGQILGCDVYASIVRASDNLVVGGPTCVEGSGLVDPVALPTTDTYVAVIDPVSFATGNQTVSLFTVTDVSGTISADGSATTVSISTPGQNALLTFSGTAGQRVSLNGSNGTIFGQIFGCDVNVSIVRTSDNLVVGGSTCMEGSGFIDTVTLPTTATYGVVVDPVSYATGSLTLNLYTVPADLSGSLTINATATGVSLATPGQNAAYTFTLSGSQSITVKVTNNTFTGAFPCVTVSLAGGSNPSSSSCSSSFNLTQQTLGAGTYTITVDPVGISTGSLSLQVTSP